MQNYGFSHDKLEIKILILYIMRRLPDAVDIDTLGQMVMCDDRISYFDFTDCLTNLVRTEHVSVSDGMYAITKKGQRNGEITENSIPFAVRTRAKELTSAVRSTQLRESLIKTEYIAKDDGSYLVRLSMSDGIGDIINIELYASNEKRAAAFEKGFREKAEEVYKTVVGAILD